MNTLFSKLGSPQWRPVTLIIAVLCLGIGFQQLYMGWQKRPLPNTESDLVGMPEQVETAEVTVLYRMQFQNPQNAWVLLNGQSEIAATFPKGLPDPSGWRPPGRPMSLPNWVAFFQESLMQQTLVMSSQTLGQLKRIAVDGEQPFASLRLDQQPQPENPKKLKPEKPAVSQPQVSNAIPPGFNPSTRAFGQQMQAWRRSIRRGLDRAPLTSDGYVVKAFHPDLGSSTQLMISSIARARILSSDFGTKRKDTIIYLQALANHHKIYIKIDGVTGPKTRKSVKEMAMIIFPSNQAAMRYFSTLKPWLGA